jgi:hypothetical protein
MKPRSRLFGRVARPRDHLPEALAPYVMALAGIIAGSVAELP